MKKNDFKANNFQKLTQSMSIVDSLYRAIYISILQCHVERLTEVIVQSVFNDMKSTLFTINMFVKN